MKCVKCGRKAIINIRGVGFCRDHFIEYYLNKVKDTIEKYKMFDKNDKILVAVSGGKDSTALAYALYKLGYNFEGLYINLEIPSYSDKCEEKVKEFFNIIGKKLNIIKVSDYRVKVKSIKNRSVCSVCGVIKRYLMNKFAYENGFNVLVTAHNLNDIASFALSNLYGLNIDFIVKNIPVIEGKDKLVKKVKPLYFLTEKEDLTFVLLKNLPYCNLECPYSENATELNWKKILYHIDSEKKDFSFKLVKSIEEISRKINIEEKEWNYCKICGYPTGSKDGICSFCKIRNYFYRNQKEKIS